MKKGVFFPLIVIFIVLAISLVSAQEIALDVKIEKQIYSLGENVTYQVLLLKDNTVIVDQVNVIISDVSNKTMFNSDVTSNKEQYLPIDESFASGYWKIEAFYENKSVKRFFSIGAREEAEFSIESDRLIIKNTGNTVYTKTVQILIGDKIVTQKQNIEVGDYKEIKLVAPDGDYDIQVSDGAESISRSNIRLVGTGNVIGALDEQLIENQPLLGAVREGDQGIFSKRNISLPVIFITAVFGIFILLMVERFIKRKSS
jgi:hypothetical protein